MSYKGDYEGLVPEWWRSRLGWADLTSDQKSAIGEFGLSMYSMGSPTVSEIDDIKYDGRLVILEDGSRWEVSSIDVNDVDLWSKWGKVVVLDDVMYRLEDAEHADVTEE